jgi:hypothetical protein
MTSARLGTLPPRTAVSSGRFLSRPAATRRELLTNRGRLLTVLALLAFGGFLLWSTLSSQRVECTITVAFKNARNTATASASSEPDATREAQTAACGPVARGMNEAIACGRIPPVSRQCRSL